MDPHRKLLVIKWVHTLIWILFVSVIFYLLYCGIMNTISVYTWLGIGFILCEGLVLLLFKMFCPLTVLARKYSDSEQANFDIFLPQWLAKHNKLIFTTLFIFAVLLILLRKF